MYNVVAHSSQGGVHELLLIVCTKVNEHLSLAEMVGICAELKHHGGQSLCGLPQLLHSQWVVCNKK